ncbi:MAG: hypothetical protein AB1792_06205 [Candidatus Zixiibacteriota bacterium]
MRRFVRGFRFLTALALALLPGRALGGGEGLDVPEALNHKVPLEGAC